jgi:rhamnose transport system permease protein
VFVMGFLTFGLGLVNVPGIVMTVVIGVLLILAIATPILIRRLTLPRRRSA